MKVLLVEPNYKNKYPPIGLMKISTYHKMRGDQVIFYKGLMPQKYLSDIDRVYITSLFTFYFNKTVETVKYYKKFLEPFKIYVGGIMITIMPKKFHNEVSDVQLLTGLLTDSSYLGFNDNINIDELPLDYSILDECEYEYPAGDNYFSYTTRGCPNKCSFCAVPILEPNFKITNNIHNQILEINQKYGERRNLLLLDNNIFNLGTTELRKLVDDLKSVGFTKTPTYIQETLYERIVKFPKNNISHRIISKTESFLINFKSRIKNDQDKVIFNEFLNGMNKCNNKKIFLCGHKKQILPIIKKYKYKKKLNRYIDFNQGLEAARITKDKMSILSELPLRPVRIAFDHYNDIFVNKYKSAIEISVNCGIKEFSNYMLYNYNDKPEDLWNRLKINIDLAKEYNISIFSFPMKYMPITETNRKYVGTYWNRHYLRSLQAILLVTKGIVADGESFFYRAFGQNCSEFSKILSMPKDFIIYRSYFEKIGLTSQWEDIYKKLNCEEKTHLIQILSNYPNIIEPENDNLVKILEFYNRSYSYENIKNKDA